MLLFQVNMTQKEYIKGGNRITKPVNKSVTESIRRIISIMLTPTRSPITPATAPYSPFCYLPPGEYLGAKSSVFYKQMKMKRLSKLSSSTNIDMPSLFPYTQHTIIRLTCVKPSSRHIYRWRFYLTVISLHKGRIVPRQ